VKDETGATPLHWAVAGDFPDIVELLLEYGANPNVGGRDSSLHMAVRRRLRDMTELLLKKGADPNVRDIDGNTPLHTAVAVGDPEIVELLIRYGADVNARNNEGKTPLDYVRYTDSNNAAKIARILLKHGAEAANKSHRKRKKKRNPTPA